MASTEIVRRPAAAPLRGVPGLHPVLARIYAARGVTHHGDLDLSLERLVPVGTLPGVAAAADVLMEHRSARVLVVGDFDADGATSSALLVRALRALGFGDVGFLVPNRFRFGYGLTPEIVALAAARRPALIVTVDNGVSSIEGVDAARALGIDVLVTDHHLPGRALPAARVIVNPNLADSTFRSPALAGVGVAFYVVAALSRVLPDTGFRPADLLDLVALGTVADVVPLDHNNRVLVAQGLRRIRAGRCVPGLEALLESGGRRLERVTAADLGFVAGPRLNAAGRLSDMTVGIECLLADDPCVAARLAAQLGALNSERRAIEQKMQLEAVDIAAALRIGAAGDDAPGLCVYDESWHQGVVGLVAGRLKDRLHRPVIAFAPSATGGLRGSARSVPGVHVRDALESIATRHPGLIDTFGGHAMAAGLSLAVPSLEPFRAAFAAEIARRAGEDSRRGVIHSDGELTRSELHADLARVLRAAGPWGQGFPEPVFDGRFEVLDSRVVGSRHLKMTLRPVGAPAREAALDAIAFGHAGAAARDPAPVPGARIHVAYRLELNEYRGAEQVQLNCLHCRPE